MNSWAADTVENCLARLALGKFSTVQARDYKPAGLYPIVDQGQSFVAGWTDDVGGLISLGEPVVVFGDHTRALKFVDFPFVRGADGTQVLKPREGIDTKYFYYACKSIDLRSRGYNRHFSALKQGIVQLPPLPEQSNIAAVLSAVDEAVVCESDIIANLATMKKAAMRDLFKHGTTGAASKHTELGQVPESWVQVPIAKLGAVVTGTTPSTKDASNYADGDISFIAPGDFEHGTRIVRTEKKITERGYSLVRPVGFGATCFVCIGSTIGKVGFVQDDRAATNQQINSIIPSAEFDERYVFHLLTYWSDLIRSQATASPVPILSKGAFEKIELFTSLDGSEQRAIAAILDAIDEKLELHAAKRSLLERLSKSLLRRLMDREIAVSDLNLSAIGRGSSEET